MTRDALAEALALREYCVETTNVRNRRGYGRTSAKRFGMKIYSTHRLAWIDAHGQLPPEDKPCVLHRCDNPPCINPDHLYAGTKADNSRDAVERERLWQCRVTHCPQDHEYTPENTIVNDRGQRSCRECRRTRDRASKAAARALQPPKQPRTHCSHGHELTPENTRWADGRWHCRKCGVVYATQYRLRKQAVA
jgi:hypothetical protein